MDRIIEQVPGCVGIADDIAVCGRTEAEHDHNLRQLMETAKREGLVFNSKKCQIKTDHIEFFGSIYTTTGIRPDPNKLEDVHQMPTPQDKDDLQRSLGLFTYLAPYIPNYADRSSILRDLLKKDVPFLWQEDHQHAFNDLKRSITPESCLRYFNPQEETTLEVDASQKGLGACLLQGGRPVAFASKSLSSAQGKLLEHWTRNTCTSVLHHEVPYLPVREDIHPSKQIINPWDDLEEAPCQRPNLASNAFW